MVFITALFSGLDPVLWTLYSVLFWCLSKSACVAIWFVPMQYLNFFQTPAFHPFSVLTGRACPNDLPPSPVFPLEICLAWMNYYSLSLPYICLRYVQFLLLCLKAMPSLESVMSWEHPNTSADQMQLVCHCDPGSSLSYSPVSSLKIFSVLHFASFPTTPYI